MSAILKHFKITPDLLRVNGQDTVAFADEPVPIEEIRATVDKIVPVNGGIPLIRLGGEGDGGYLVPDDLQGIEACFSPGVNNFKDFEDSLVNTYRIRTYMCDYSSDVEKLRTPLIPQWQFFDKKWLDVEASDINLDLNRWVAENTSAGTDLLLQMDIEGAEFRNLLHATEATLARFRIIVLEVHYLHMLSNAEYFHGVFRPVFDKLSKHFACVHYHPNNCCGEATFGDITVPKVLELTFLRRDRLKPTEELLLLPHPLDRTNLPELPPMHAADFFLAHADREKSELIGLRSAQQWQQRYIQVLESSLAEANARAGANAESATAADSPKPVAGAVPAVQGTDLFQIIASLSLPSPKGMLQVGASYGQEFETFKANGVRCGVFIEPLPEPFAHLSAICQRTPGMVAVQALCADVSGRNFTFHIASNAGQSSSVLPPANHLVEFGSVRFEQAIQLTSTSLDDLLASVAAHGKGYADICEGLDTLYMDTQGAELMVLQGGSATLARMNYVYTEVTRNELYQGAPALDELVRVLAAAGFSLNNVNFNDHHCADALFIRNSVLGMGDRSAAASQGGSVRVLVEGWRGISHSYSLVNQYQLQEWSRYSGLTVTHKDMPLFFDRWKTQKGGSGFPEGQAQAIASIPAWDGGPYDVCFRIYAPFTLEPDPRHAVLTFMVTELGLGAQQLATLQPNAAAYFAAGGRVVTPSRWSRDRLIDAGLIPEHVHVVAHGVAGDIYRPMTADERLGVRQNLGFQPENVVFLNVGAPIWNKGMDVLISCFIRCFLKQPHTRLILKDQEALYGVSAKDAILREIAKAGQMGNAALIAAIRLISGDLSLTQLRELYGIADYYVSPYRAEGFNMPVMEAIACGTPVIVTQGGATDDYCTRDNAIFIEATPYRGVRLPNDDIGSYQEPSPDSLLAILESCAHAPAFSASERSRNAANMATQHAWSDASRKVADILVAGSKYIAERRQT